MLSAAWEKAQPYALLVGLAAVGILALASIWIALSRHYAARADRPWEEHFEIARELADAGDDREERVRRFFEQMEGLADTYRGRAVASVALLKLAQGHARRAADLRSEDPDAAKEHLEDAADAAEQFVADFSDHRHLALAYYEAGKARLELGEYERAADHFAQATRSPIRYLQVLAKWHRAFCYEQLGRLDEARRIYEAIRDDQTAGWCADQAEFQLTQLGRWPRKENPPEAASPAPSSGSPAPSK
jgi:tetratricopeptide (TPR) repeat protein